jgi:hypothetical protein
MRVLLAAMTVCLLLFAAGSVEAAALSEPSASAAPAAPAAPAAATGTSADNDAAAKHAKRTACLKEARAKKLVGAQKTAYIKDCAAVP